MSRVFKTHDTQKILQTPFRYVTPWQPLKFRWRPPGCYYLVILMHYTLCQILWRCGGGNLTVAANSGRWTCSLCEYRGCILTTDNSNACGGLFKLFGICVLECRGWNYWRSSEGRGVFLKDCILFVILPQNHKLWGNTHFQIMQQ